MKRLANWELHLDRFLQEHLHREFRYGAWDCCLWVCDAIQAMTAVDLAARFRGQYGSHRSAIRAMKAYCGRASLARVAELVAAENRMPAIPLLTAGRGDMVLIKRPWDFSLGLVALNGSDVLVLAATDLKRLPLEKADRAWRV